MVRRWRASGKTPDTFATEQGLSAKSLVWWAWRLGKEAEPRPRATRARALQLVPVRVAETTAPPAPGLVLELTSASGERLRISGGVGASELRTLVEALIARRPS